MRKKSKKQMSPRQKLFCKEYLVDLNATNAANRAGYSKKTAYSQGQRLLKNVEIKERIQLGMDRRAKKIEITAENVLKELSKMAFANMMDYITITDNGEAFIDLSKLTRDQAAALHQVECDTSFDKDLRKRVLKTKIRLSDKKASLELLGKHLKLFNDKDSNDEGDTYITNIINSFNERRDLTAEEERNIREEMGKLSQDFS